MARDEQYVLVSTLARKFDFENLTYGLDLDQFKIVVPDINRPSLQATGYWDYFMPDRVQIVGKVEFTYMERMPKEERLNFYAQMFSTHIPCVIYARDQKPDDEVVDLATKMKVPLLLTGQTTSVTMAEVIRWLHVQLAPMISVHGVLVDVYGEGVLITGESGIGKSEVALELIKRGHRLVSDDVVEIRKVSDDTLIGSAPAITRHFIELRGIGIIDVKTLFGIECVKNTQAIDLVIQMENWTKETEYDRMGLDEKYIEYLGNRVVCHHLPVRPGRNISIIVESAAVNHRQKKMGYNAAQEFYKRVQRSIAGNLEDDSHDFFF